MKATIVSECRTVKGYASTITYETDGNPSLPIRITIKGSDQNAEIVLHLEELKKALAFLQVSLHGGSFTL